jgi:hypothetical protein
MREIEEFWKSFPLKSEELSILVQCKEKMHIAEVAMCI